MSYWHVYIDGKTSRCVPEGSAEAKVCIGEGMTLVQSDAISRFEGWTTAAVRYGCIPDDYDDAMRPGIISEPTTLYRSVSLQEMDNIFSSGAVQGGGNRFNSHEGRPFVFFASVLNQQCIGQAEDVTRIAEYLAITSILDDTGDVRDRDALKRAYRDALAKEQAARTAMTYSSCVIETAPISLGFHYSLETGTTGMNGNDEFGLFPGQVTIEMINNVHWIKNGVEMSSSSIEEAVEILSELRRERDEVEFQGYGPGL
jgi:hypothetical protein